MQEIISKFTERFGMNPVAVSRAPGRLEILGNHTDYNEGFVLSCAVTQDTRIALAPIEGTICHVVDFRTNEEMSFDLSDIDAPPAKNGSRYIKGMARELMKLGYKIPAFNCGLESTIPLSAGMSSSAALETAAGLAMGKAFDIQLSKEEWAKAGQRVENDYMGLKTGLLDQFSSIFGEKDAMILSDFRTVKVIRTVPLPPGYSIVVINSMEKHDLVDSEYNSRRQDCETAASVLAQITPDTTTLRDIDIDQLASGKSLLNDVEYRRALHVVGECARVSQAVRYLSNNDIENFGKLLFESHQSSKDNFENSTKKLDYLVELAKTIPGALGARLSGGGFGGITIHLVKNEDAETYAKQVQAAYKIQTGIEPEYIICNIGAGASAELVK